MFEGEEPTTPGKTEFYEPVPPRVRPGEMGLPPSDAVVLFDGSDLEQWQSSVTQGPAEWILNDDGSMTVKDKSGDIETKEHFGSVQLHLEWRSPSEIKALINPEGTAVSFFKVFMKFRFLTTTITRLMSTVK